MARAHAHVGETRYRVDLKAGHHALVADEHADLGGQDAGPAPYELLLAALGACTSITLKMYAERKSWPLAGVDVALLFTRDGDSQKIERTLTLEGDLDDAQRARLADIAERTPVTLTLKAGVAITTRLR
ncbi:OsmC family protein [Phenylobacterium montanum]|uniref:OsmC family protein n=1 Tax=Phenylobacterium montanum TaxID=2823693 RepID=A0A975FXW9_9CAUL|nr:OsmC family protein [Caulobacter sp. S6]QUD86847.1 OsmC family protein [Caulobacter sp. S6]